MSKKQIILPLVILLSLIIAGIWPIQPALTIMDGRSGKLVYASSIKIAERFVIQFIHSIHKTPVYEEYYIDDDLHIILDQVIYESLGVGNPSSPEPGQTFEIKDGKYIIGNIDRRLPYFDLAIGQVIAHHQIKMRDQWIPLETLNPPGSWVRVQIKKVSFVTLWKGRKGL